MKKISLILSLLVLTTMLYAQNTKGPRFGLMGVPHFNWLKPDNAKIETTTRVGIKYGAVGEFFFADNYAFTVGAYHALSSGKLNHEDNSYRFFTRIEDQSSDEINQEPKYKDYKVNLQYVEIPIGLKLQTNEIGYLTYFGHIGINPGFNVRARLDAKSTSDNNEDFENQDVFKDIETLDFSLRVGGGAEYSLTESVSLLAALYFNNGFVDVLPDGDGEKLFRKNVGLRLGVMF